MKRILRSFLLAGLVAGFPLSASAEPVDINRADAQTIAANLKGIGVKKAEAIVAHRDANGPFKAPEDLTQVKGIGAHTVDMNRADIRIKAEGEQR